MKISLAGLSASQLISAHSYQFDGTHRNRNECALCAGVMLLSLAAQISGTRDRHLQAAALGRFLDRFPFRYLRFPGWFPGPGGATHPLGVAHGLRNYIARNVHGKDFSSWRPVLRVHQSVEDLTYSLANGFPTLIYGVGRTGIPHVVVPIGREQASWQILDPGYPRERNPMPWSDQQLLDWWRNYSIFYPRGTLISLIRN